jgi:DNA-directed RNA polymerase subunit RPC12/RpoP
MDIQFDCPRCGQNLSVEQTGAGMTVNCPGCKGQIEIPRGTPPQASKESVPATPDKPQAAVFYVRRGGTELGQFNEQEFRENILTGSIRPGDHYWSEGTDDWQLVSEYRGLSSPTTPPTLPPVPRMPGDEKKEGSG